MKTLVLLATLALASYAPLTPAVKQKLLLDGTGLLITGGEALLLSGGNGKAAITAMSEEAVANVPGLKAVIADSVKQSAKNPVAAVPVTISMPAAVETSPVTP